MPTTQTFQFGARPIDLSLPQVMGILNITPDSFSDGGELFSSGKPQLAKVVDRAAAMVAAGASFLDVGGESTRPGAQTISAQEELDRVLPVLGALSQRFDVVLSVDTSSPLLISQAAAHGAGLINDIRALTQPGAVPAARESGLMVCLMHMQGQPDTMQNAPVYGDVVGEILAYLRERVSACVAEGLPRERLLLDPGFGFGKTLEHNLVLLDHLDQLQQLGLPLLVGLSRKRMLGTITGKPEKEREVAGVVAATIAMMNGAKIIRTHDVAATVDAVKICSAVFKQRSK